MQKIISKDAFKPFDPEMVEAMKLAFDAAWQSITVSGVVYLDGVADRIREALALRIIAKAQAGERNIEALRDDAIAHVMGIDGAGIFSPMTPDPAALYDPPT